MHAHFSLIFYLLPFPASLLPLKLLFICRSGRDGNFLACPLPWLCFRPAGLVTCCFFADFCAHCLFACRALCFGCLFICLCCLRGFSLLFFTFSCLTFSSQTSFHLSLRPRRGFPRLSPPVALFPTCAPLFCRLYADFCACLSGLRCLTAVRFVCAVLFCFGCLFACSVLVARAFFSYLLSFAFFCLVFAAQTSFYLSLRPRRGFSRLSPPVALFPACMSCRLLLFRGLLRPLPVFPFCVVRTGFLPCFFALSCLTSSSQISFHLSLRPRRASTFFRKESRQRFAKGLRPFEPHSCALSPISPFFSLLAGLAALWAANRRQIRETLEKPKEQSSSFSSVSVRKENASALRPISPFPALLAGLSGPLGRKPPADKGNA